MLVVLILFAIVTIWYCIGFSPSFRIDRENFMLHTYGMGKKILWFVNGDRGLGWVSVPLGFSKPKIKQTWTMPLRGNIEDLPKKNSIGETIYYGKPREVKGLNYPIITASDTTNKLQKLNKQILVIEIQFPICAKTFYITLGTVFTIFDGKKFITLKDGILLYTEREVKDALNPWFIKNEETWHEAWKKLPAEKVIIGGKQYEVKSSFSMYVLQQMELLRIDKINSISVEVFNEQTGAVIGEMPFRQYLDEKKFEKKYGFRFGEMSYELGYGDDVEELKKQRNEQEKQTEQLNTNIATEKARDVSRQTELNDAKNDAEKISVLWVEQSKIAEKLAEYATNIAAAYKVQVLSTDGNNDFFKQMAGPLAAGLVTLKPKNQGGNNNV